ncbi:cellulose biosynthesis cyclic di-GMP-binding regulatory protein BcsB, partial [Ruminiclostridium cellobioparum]|uniref:cellulose biosynthesis cyclic di-GMP-binding regulatory protein BcsB n=1 Tax=Ruminiclostridium cellobioparum TaxID=29355 RepID=UPI0028ABE777
MFMFVLKGRRSKFFRVSIFVLITVVFAAGGTARDVYAAPAAKASIAEAAATDVSGRDNKDKIISSEDALLSSVGSMLENAGAPASTKPKLPKAGLTEDFTWDAPQILKGIYSSADLYFSLPKYWSTKYVCVKLEYRVSQMIKDTPCTLTFAINKQPFYSCQLTYKNNEKNFIYVLIPANLIKNDRESSTNTLTISGYARLYNDQGCIDDESNANWITFSEASGVEVGYDLLAHQNRIDFYPYPFISSDNQSGADTAVTVADTAQNEEVAAAMVIMTGLGKNTKNNNNLEISSWQEAQSGGKSRNILVGLTKDMPAGLTKYIQPYRNQLKGQVMLLF